LEKKGERGINKKNDFKKVFPINQKGPNADLRRKVSSRSTEEERREKTNQTRGGKRREIDEGKRGGKKRRGRWEKLKNEGDAREGKRREPTSPRRKRKPMRSGFGLKEARREGMKAPSCSKLWTGGETLRDRRASASADKKSKTTPYPSSGRRRGAEGLPGQRP